MKHAESVTFGGSALDRAAEMRGDADALRAAREDPGARTILLWRGKPLIRRERPAQLMRLPLDHPVLADAGPDAVLLGREDGSARFALSLDAWEPQGQDLSQVDKFVDPSEQQHPDLPDGQVFAELRRIMSWLTPRDAELAATARALFEWHRIHGFCARCGAESAMTMSGWQRDCPVCGGRHFPRTDPVVIMLITRGNSVLLGRSHGWPDAMYSLLAGFVEPGETLEAAVRRETLEETGIRIGPVRYLASQPWPFPASLMIGCAGEALNDRIIVDPVEIEDAIWATREEIMEAFAGHHPRLLPARKGAIARFLLENWLADTLD